MHASVMRSMLVLCLLLLIYQNQKFSFMQFAVYVIMAYCENTKRTKKKKIFCS